jgi:transcription antitermination factor NusG
MHGNLALAYPCAMNASPATRWYVVTCEPTRDGRALVLLREQGYEAVSLKVYVGWVSRRTFRDTIELMLPGYLLVRLDPETTYWKGLLETKFVTGVLRTEGRPDPLRDDAAEKLMERMDCTGLVNPHEVRRKPPMRVYEKGQPLTITEGPFMGLPAKFKDRAGDRIVAFLKLLGGEVEAVIPEVSIEPVELRPPSS